MNAALPRLAGRPSPGSGSVPALAVARLVLTDFRSYAGARLEVDSGPVVLTGPNGAGKTNLLEALSFLSPGRGLRRARLAEADRRGPDGAPAGGTWAVAASVRGIAGPVEIGTGRDPAAADGESGDGRRVVRVDGAPARSQAALADHMAMVWLTPDIDRIFMEGRSERRRFLDRLVYGFEPGHAARVAAYEQAMRERGRLLRAPRADGAWLSALEDRMAREGVAVAAARRDYLARLSGLLARPEGPFPQAEAALAGEVEEWLTEGPALAAEDRLREALSASRRRDAEAGRALAGPHRTDLAVRHVAKGRPAAECSTGEQKALLVALTLAHARLRALDLGAAPVLLLDEVAAHLDGTRREALFDALSALGAQAWLTGTDRALFAPLQGRAQYVEVTDGRLVRQS